MSYSSLVVMSNYNGLIILNGPLVISSWKWKRKYEKKKEKGFLKHSYWLIAPGSGTLCNTQLHSSFFRRWLHTITQAIKYTTTVTRFLRRVLKSVYYKLASFGGACKLPLWKKSGTCKQTWINHRENCVGSSAMCHLCYPCCCIFFHVLGFGWISVETGNNKPGAPRMSGQSQWVAISFSCRTA